MKPSLEYEKHLRSPPVFLIHCLNFFSKYSVLKGGIKKRMKLHLLFLEFEKKFHIAYKTVTGRFLPYVGWVTIIMTEKPIIKV